MHFKKYARKRCLEEVSVTLVFLETSLQNAANIKTFSAFSIWVDENGE